ncbi:hypothetical protein AVEN_176108-1, partial [Araneus ventricosus]
MCRRRNDTSVRIPPTTVHKCKPRAIRSHTPLERGFTEIVRVGS